MSLGAFEHFADGIGTYDRYTDFFKMCYNVMPDDGVMLLQSIVLPSAEEAEQLGLKRTMSLLRFIRFILTEIFPGGRLPMISVVDDYVRAAGFHITRHHCIGKNHVPTLDSWAKALEAHKDEAIALQSEEVYELPALPDRLPRVVPRRLRRRLPGHPGEESRLAPERSP